MTDPLHEVLDGQGHCAAEFRPERGQLSPDQSVQIPLPVGKILFQNFLWEHIRGQKSFSLWLCGT